MTRPAAIVLLAASLSACATPAIVVVSRDYDPARVHRVTLTAFADFPGAAGSGAMATDTFEKYLVLAGYSSVEPGDADAQVQGSVTDFTAPSAQTVMVDIPQQEVDPLYGTITTTQRSGGARVTTVQNVVTGYATTQTDTVVPETEIVPAHAALSVRLVDARTGALLWSVSSDGDGRTLASALEATSAKAMQAVAKRVKAAGAR